MAHNSTDSAIDGANLGGMTDFVSSRLGDDATKIALAACAQIGRFVAVPRTMTLSSNDTTNFFTTFIFGRTDEYFFDENEPRRYVFKKTDI